MKDHTYKLTGNILKGKYLAGLKRSCKLIDRPTNELIYIVVDGKTIERTVYERVFWRNMDNTEVVSYFIIYYGEYLEIEKVNAAHERELGYNTAKEICENVSVIDAKETISWLYENDYSDEYVNGFIVAIAEHLCPKN